MAEASSSRSSIWVTEPRRSRCPGSPASRAARSAAAAPRGSARTRPRRTGPRMRSCHALASVRPSTSSGTRRRRRPARPAGRLRGAARRRPPGRRAPGRHRLPGARRGPGRQDGAHRPSVHAGAWSAAPGRAASPVPPGGGALRRRGAACGGPASARGRTAGSRPPVPPVPAGVVPSGVAGRGGHAVDDRLGDVVGVEVLAADLRAGLQVLEHPGDGDVEARRRPTAGCRCRRAGLSCDRRLGDVAPVPAHRLDVVVLGAPERDRDASRRTTHWVCT